MTCIPCLGAATSLKHATPRDLPSYPSVGLANLDSASGAAASLASNNQTPFELWKPGEIPAANKAAYLAKDTKGPDIWQPTLSAAGSKAALQAQREGANVNIWRPEETDAGTSAAGQAMRMKGLSPQTDRGYTAEGGRRALVAATGAMSGSRKRADSTPSTMPAYPDANNSTTNALRAATSVHKSPKKAPVSTATTSGPQLNAARIHNQAVTNLSREMYTSNPPVAPEVEERKRQEGLRAAAVSMAKSMYEIQQKQFNEAAALSRTDSHYAATTVHNRPASSASSDESHQVPPYTNLQEAAKKLAAERLAKLHDEHAAYRNYYGTQTPTNRKISVRGRARRRASSEGELDDDEERARQVRNQMSLFTDKLAQVDNKKRQKDRDSLLAAAQRNVRASMAGMDEKVFNETGKISPAMMEEWEAKAKAKAQAESETRMVNHGKVHIGGGKFLDQSEVDAIAAAKVQPTLDEITETAEKQRARDEEIREMQRERERVAAEKVADDKERARQTKEEWRKFKGEIFNSKYLRVTDNPPDEEKREKQAKKDEEKAQKAEERRLREEEKRKARGDKERSKTVEAAGVGAALPVEAQIPEVPESEPKASEESGFKSTEEPPSEDTEPDAEDEELERFNTAETGDAPEESEESKPAAGDIAEDVAKIEPETIDDNTIVPGTKHEEPVSSRIALPTVATTAGAAIPAPTTETTVSGPNKSPKEKDSNKVSSWLKTKFSRRTSKPVKPEASSLAAATSAPSAPETEKDKTVLSTTTDPGAPTGSEQGEDSMREVAIAGKDFAGTATPLTSHPTHPTTFWTGEAGTAAAVATSTPPVGAPHPDVDAPAAQSDLYDNEEDGDRKDSKEATTPGDNESVTSSPEISSLSSDEDTRGRSAIRLADEMGLPTGTEAQQPVNKRAGMVVPDLPAEAIAATSASTAEKESDLTEDKAAEEGEDAVEDLPPPSKLNTTEGRASESSARDSRFVEEL